MKYKAALSHFDENNLKEKIHDCLEWINWKERIYPDSNVYVKPNLTFPEFREGVTTTPHFIAALLDVLKERTSHITVVEADGGNNSYPADKAFETHNLYEICESRNVRLINLSRQEWSRVDVPAGFRTKHIPLSKEMLEQADLTISVPVPKMHFVARFTGAVKNHWGLIPDSMRLRNHYFFKYAINVIIKTLKSDLTVVDGEYFLDDNGPVTGDPVKMNVVMAANGPHVADLVLMDIMGVDPEKIPYMKIGQKMGLAPSSLNDIELNTDLENFKTHQFSYHRDPVDYLALLGFHSRIVTWLVYLSPLRKFAHWMVKMLRGSSRQVDEYYTGIIEKNKP